MVIMDPENQEHLRNALNESNQAVSVQSRVNSTTAGNDAVTNFYANRNNQQNQITVTRSNSMSNRREFLSRPSWLFQYNENVLFCTALNNLRFDDQNNVPRKFIEEWLSNEMVKVNTPWPSGERFLNETINDLTRDKEKFKAKRQRIWESRRSVFYKLNQQKFAAAQRALNADPNSAEKLAAFNEAQREACKSIDEMIQPPLPSETEVALEELQTKIVRRLQGQTDRIEMASELANKPYDSLQSPEYFEKLQVDVLKAINEKHQEIVQDREKVETKSKQSRKRRRNQVNNGTTMSGSATRIRFTNREISMLIHWIYTYTKDEWSGCISEFYTKQGHSRSAEHVRDKLRDLIAKSEKGELKSIKVRSSAPYYSKNNESKETRDLAIYDLQDFKYPDGVLKCEEKGRYFDEERSEWVVGNPPPHYIQRYHDEINRIRNVVRAKVDRLGKPVVEYPYQNAYQPNTQMLNDRAMYKFVSMLGGTENPDNLYSNEFPIDTSLGYMAESNKDMQGIIENPQHVAALALDHHNSAQDEHDSNDEAKRKIKRKSKKKHKKSREHSHEHQ